MGLHLDILVYPLLLARNRLEAQSLKLEIVLVLHEAVSHYTGLPGRAFRGEQRRLVMIATFWITGAGPICLDGVRSIALNSILNNSERSSGACSTA
jgi:hypothetical protein